MEYTFKLSNRKDGKNMGNVYARIRFGKTDRKLGMGFCITREEWQKYRTGQYLGKNLMPSIGITYGKFADILRDIKSRIEIGYDPETTGQLIRSQVAMLMSGRSAEETLIKPKENTKGKNERILLTTYIGSYLRDLISGKRLKEGRSEKVSEDYARNFHALITDIKAFEKERRKGRITLDAFSKKMHDELLAWYHKRGILPNTIMSKFKCLHVILSTAYEEKVSGNMSFCHSDFIPKGQEVDNVYLTPEQIQQMYELDLSDPEKVRKIVSGCTFSEERAEKVRVLTRGKSILKIEYVRDIFVIGCLTGQRISDYRRISDDMLLELDSLDFIKLEQIKTGKKVVIPMDCRVAEILRKYNGFPPSVTDQRMNDVLQLLGEMLGWTWEVKFDESRMGRKRGTRFCDMISTHTARRSFATNAYAAGVPLSSIMAVTGHSTEKTLRRYLKLMDEERAMKAFDDMNGFLDLDFKVDADSTEKTVSGNSLDDAEELKEQSH